MSTIHAIIDIALADFDASVARALAKMDADDRRNGWGKYAAEKQRDDANEVWAEMTAEMRAHEAGE